MGLAVALALETGGLAAGRQAVSAIVGRDPDALDQAALLGQRDEVQRRHRTPIGMGPADQGLDREHAAAEGVNNPLRRAH